MARQKRLSAVPVEDVEFVKSASDRVEVQILMLVQKQAYSKHAIQLGLGFSEYLGKKEFESAFQKAQFWAKRYILKIHEVCRWDEENGEWGIPLCYRDLRRDENGDRIETSEEWRESINFYISQMPRCRQMFERWFPVTVDRNEVPSF